MRASGEKVTRLRGPTAADFALVRWLGREAFEGRAVGFRRPRPGAREFWEQWVHVGLPARLAYGGARMRAAVEVEEANLRRSLARDAERRGPAPVRWEVSYGWYPGPTSEAGKLTAAYLLGPATPTRFARLSAALLGLLGEDVFDEFTDALLPGWREYRNDADRQKRADAWIVDLPRLFVLRGISPATAGDDRGEEAQALDRLTGGAPDFAPRLLWRLAHEAADPRLLHRRDVHETLTGAQKVALHRIRRGATSPLLGALDAWRAAARESGWTPEPYLYRKPRGGRPEPPDKRAMICGRPVVRRVAQPGEIDPGALYVTRPDLWPRRARNTAALETAGARTDARRVERSGYGSRGVDPFVLNSRLTYPHAGMLGGTWDEGTMLGLGVTGAVRGGRVHASDGRTYRVVPHQQVSRAELERRRFARLATGRCKRP